jgi:hypothetical protein
MNDHLLYLALARLAFWNNFEVGVLEGNGAKFYTLVVKFPTGTIAKRIPARMMEGVWNQITVDPKELPENQKEMERRMRLIVYGSLVRTIHTMKF